MPRRTARSLAAHSVARATGAGAAKRTAVATELAGLAACSGAAHVFAALVRATDLIYCATLAGRAAAAALSRLALLAIFATAANLAARHVTPSCLVARTPPSRQCLWIPFLPSSR